MHFPIVLIAMFCLCETQAAKLPSSFGLCHKSADNFQECLSGNIEKAIKILKTGSPQLGLHPFEPLEIPELRIGAGTGPVAVAQNFRNVKIHGLTDSHVTYSELNSEKFVIFAQSISPELRLGAEYEMKGQVLLLPIVGDGPCNVTLFNTRINHTIIGEPLEKKGKIYFKVKDYIVTLRPEKVTFKFDNLFNGEEPLGSEINKVLNDNWSEVFTDVRDGYEKSFGLIFYNLALQVFNRVPMDSIFLE